MALRARRTAAYPSGHQYTWYVHGTDGCPCCGSMEVRMSIGFHVTEYIALPIEKMWGRLTDWGRMPDWMNGIDEIRLADGQEAGEGARIVFRARGAERDSVIVSWSPPERLTLRSVQGGMTAVYQYTCKADGVGTRVTLDARCQAEGLGWRMVSPLIGYLMKRSDSTQMQCLKRLVESS